MDKLDEQLRHLSILNSCLPLAETNTDDVLSGNHIDVAVNIEESNTSGQEYNAALQNHLIYNYNLGSSKKIGPIVPPKPLKKSYTPEIPQSSLVKQTCEPLYAQRLQNLEGDNYAASEICRLSLLQCKRNSYSLLNTDVTPGSSSYLALKTRHKVTLDNPIVLEQQLEALEHHKKQLEKQGRFHPAYSGKILTPNMNVPKLPLATLVTEVGINPQNVLESLDATYVNAINTTTTATNLISTTVAKTNSNMNAYDNSVPPSLLQKTTSINNIYSNVVYDKHKKKTTCIEEHKNLLFSVKSKSALLHSDNIYLSHNNFSIIDDETQPPPSPVSSSYSELRRATEIFKSNIPSKVSPINSFDSHINLPQSIVEYDMPHDHKQSATGGDIRRQLYINKLRYAPNDGFTNYNKILQAKNNVTFSDYYGYGGFSQTSTYESIYEPINPIPSSELSLQSNNLIYPTCVKNSNSSTLPEWGSILGKRNSSNLSTFSGLSGNSADSNSPQYPNSSRGSESGVTLKSGGESIPDFTTKSINPQQDLENYGICYKCNEIVIGENSGCTAMDQIYHIACFTCSQCQINLQGKPFYSLDCKPYCEFDYLQTLEKCAVCMKPILERILRATGKPYHPQCFTCVVCKKSLDGIPFTVDATNQNYCIEDFHNKFAPRCCVCKTPIMPEPGEEETVRVVALDRSFHFECYKCEDCGLLLSSEAEGRGCYPLDDHVLCKSCNAKRVQMLTNRMTTKEL